MNVRYIVALESSERQQLEALSAGGTCAVRRIKRAQILLAADAGRTDDEQIANTAQVSTTTVYRTKRRFVHVVAFNCGPRTTLPRERTTAARRCGRRLPEAWDDQAMGLSCQGGGVMRKVR